MGAYIQGPFEGMGIIEDVGGELVFVATGPQMGACVRKMTGEDPWQARDYRALLGWAVGLSVPGRPGWKFRAVEMTGQGQPLADVVVADETGAARRLAVYWRDRV